jgi:hypothetical protein
LRYSHFEITLSGSMRPAAAVESESPGRKLGKPRLAAFR